jgi:hypothetical protein
MVWFMGLANLGMNAAMPMGSLHLIRPGGFRQILRERSQHPRPAAHALTLSGPWLMAR